METENNRDHDPIIGRDERDAEQKQGGQQGETVGHAANDGFGEPGGQRGQDADAELAQGAQTGGQDTGQSLGDEQKGAGYGDQGAYGQGADSAEAGGMQSEADAD